MMTIAIPVLTANFLVAIRVGVVLLFTPIQAIRQLPVHARLIILLAFSSLLVSNLSLATTKEHEIALALSAVAELCNGLILSMSLYAAFAVFHIAGQLIDTQMGLKFTRHS